MNKMKKTSEQSIKQNARKKFGSVTRFAQAAGIQALEIYSTFRMKDENEYKQAQLDKLQRLIQSTKPIVMNKDWREGLGEKVRAEITKQHGTVTAFCSKYPQFKNYWVSLILNDKKVRVSNKVAEVLRILKIDLNKI